MPSVPPFPCTFSQIARYNSKSRPYKRRAGMWKARAWHISSWRVLHCVSSKRGLFKTALIHSVTRHLVYRQVFSIVPFGGNHSGGNLTGSLPDPIQWSRSSPGATCSCHQVSGTRGSAPGVSNAIQTSSCKVRAFRLRNILM